MRKGSAWLLFFSLTLFLPMKPSYSQTSAQIESLLKKSKLVDTGRQVNATVAPNKTTISTYCHPQATNQDCKVTALLMMKELKQHYKSIHRIHVLFYDPANPKRFRAVEIREGDTLLVDAGKPLPEVLSQIDVINHKVATVQNTRRTISTRAAGLTLRKRSIQVPFANAPSGFINYRSPDGQISVAYPSDWVLDTSEAGQALVKAVTVNTQNTGVMAIYRHIVEGTSLDNIVNMHEVEGQGRFKSYQKISQRSQDSNGHPGIYVEANITAPNGTVVIEQAEWVRNQDNYYGLILYTTGWNRSDASRLFQTMISSFKIQS